MPQITLHVVLSLVWLALSLLQKVLRLINSVVDVLDDGVINDSFKKPVWYDKFLGVIDTLTSSKEELMSLTKDMSSPVSVPSEESEG